jgi:CRP-like cAMP-binding protein
MAGKAEFTFDPKAFLATVGQGHTVSDLRKDEVVFRQSAAADAVFYIQKGKIKITVASKEGKEAVVGISRAKGTRRRRRAICRKPSAMPSRPSRR